MESSLENTKLTPRNLVKINKVVKAFIIQLKQTTPAIFGYLSTIFYLNFCFIT